MQPAGAVSATISMGAVWLPSDALQVRRPCSARKKRSTVRAAPAGTASGSTRSRRQREMARPSLDGNCRRGCRALETKRLVFRVSAYRLRAGGRPDITNVFSGWCAPTARSQPQDTLFRRPSSWTRAPGRPACARNGRCRASRLSGNLARRERVGHDASDPSWLTSFIHFVRATTASPGASSSSLRKLPRSTISRKARDSFRICESSAAWSRSTILARASPRSATCRCCASIS